MIAKLTNCAPKNDGNIVLAEIEKCGPNAFEWNDEPGKNCAPGWFGSLCGWGLWPAGRFGISEFFLQNHY